MSQQATATKAGRLSGAVSGKDLITVLLPVVLGLAGWLITNHVEAKRLELTVQQHIAQPSHPGTAAELQEISRGMARVEAKVDALGAALDAEREERRRGTR